MRRGLRQTIRRAVICQRAARFNAVLHRACQLTLPTEATCAIEGEPRHNRGGVGGTAAFPDF